MPKVTRVDAIICHQCGLSSHELTDKYNPSEAINGTMVTLREPYKSYGWESHPEDPGAFEGDILCGFCDAPLAPEDRLITEKKYVDDNGAEVEMDNNPPDPRPKAKKHDDSSTESTKSTAKSTAKSTKSSKKHRKTKKNS